MKATVLITGVSLAVALTGCGGNGGGGGDAGGGGGAPAGPTASAFNASVARVVDTATSDTNDSFEIAAVLPVELATGTNTDDDTKDAEAINTN